MKKILIVDDEEHIRELLIQTLEDLEDLEDDPVELLEAENGKKALELIKVERPELVFLDVMMPEMNGMEVCQTVKSDDELKDTHIIILTAKGQEMDKKEGESVGANRYMTKPFNPKQIFALAMEILEIEE